MTNPEPGPGPTAQLCHGLVELSRRPLPEAVARQAQRSLLNVAATAVGAARHPAVEAVVATGGALGGVPQVPVLGRAERLDPLWAATANGLAAHVDDFDDTHLETVIHPGAATLAAVVSAGVARTSSGSEVLAAFALGCEAQLRIGAAMTPWHYEAGWHITGTCGVMGAAVAAGLLAGLDSGGLARAIGLAASQTVGQRESFGTMIKGLTPGKAASNGLLGVMLAERGFTASDRVLEAPRGFINVLSPDGSNLERVTGGLGQRWELLENTFKPYPCGIVCHPAIEAAIELASTVASKVASTVAASEITSVRVRCHPLVTELTGNADPRDGLEARFSTAHGVASGLLDGVVNLAHYAAEWVRAPEVVALRRKVVLDVDEGCARDEATVTVEWNRHVEESHVIHARGSLARPLTDEELRDKVAGLVEPVLPGSSEALIAAVEALPHAPGLHVLLSEATAQAAEREFR